MSRGCPAAGGDPLGTGAPPVTWMGTEAGVDPARIAQLQAAERARFAASHPRALEFRHRAEHAMLYGVPMNWMTRWASPAPIVAAEAHGAEVEDIDGNHYVDFCLGDTGAMAGHAPGPVVEAVARQMGRGATFMLPTEDADLGRGRDVPAVRHGALAVLPDSHRRQPFRAAARPADHRPPGHRRAQLVLPRLGRRDAGQPRCLGRGRAAGRQRRARPWTSRHRRGWWRSTISLRSGGRSRIAPSPACWSSPPLPTSGSCCLTRSTTPSCGG